MSVFASVVLDAAVALYERTFVTVPLHEGIDDPGIFKCVFMAGGPGSGKSYTAADLFGIDRRFKSSFSTYGLKVVNSDAPFEYLLNKLGVDPKALADIERDNPDLWNALTGRHEGSVRERAKQLTRMQHANFLSGKLGLIIDGTGDDFNKMQRQKSEAEAHGYDCFMVCVNTDLDTALERNRMRERVLPDAIVREIWTNVQQQVPHLRGLFGRNFIEIHMDTPRGLDSAVQKAVRAFVAQPIQNPLGREWLTIARAAQALARR